MGMLHLDNKRGSKNPRALVLCLVFSGLSLSASQLLAQTTMGVNFSASQPVKSTVSSEAHPADENVARVFSHFDPSTWQAYERDNTVMSKAPVENPQVTKAKVPAPVHDIIFGAMSGQSPREKSHAVPRALQPVVSQSGLAKKPEMKPPQVTKAKVPAPVYDIMFDAMSGQSPREKAHAMPLAAKQTPVGFTPVSVNPKLPATHVMYHPKLEARRSDAELPHVNILAELTGEDAVAAVKALPIPAAQERSTQVAAARFSKLTGKQGKAHTVPELAPTLIIKEDATKKLPSAVHKGWGLVKTGRVEIGKNILSHLKASGDVRLIGTKVSGATEVRGSLNASNVSFGSVVVYGDLDVFQAIFNAPVIGYGISEVGSAKLLDQAIFYGNTHIFDSNLFGSLTSYGQLDLKHSTILGLIKTTSQKIDITGSKIQDLHVGAQNVKAIVTLRNSTVKGDIDFTKHAGQVVLLGHSVILGQVKNGTMRTQAGGYY